MSAHITRPIAPRALLREIERVFCNPPAGGSDPLVDPWDRRRYDEWVERLGVARMQGVLAKLLDELRRLLVLTLEAATPEAQHRLAHDVASTAGMLGFMEVTRRCRAVLENDAPPREESSLRSELAHALEAAIHRLDGHLAAVPAGAAA